MFFERKIERVCVWMCVLEIEREQLVMRCTKIELENHQCQPSMLLPFLWLDTVKKARMVLTHGRQIKNFLIRKLPIDINSSFILIEQTADF